MKILLQSSLQGGNLPRVGVLPQPDTCEAHHNLAAIWQLAPTRLACDLEQREHAFEQS